MTQFLDVFIPKTITTLIINESASKEALKAAQNVIIYIILLVQMRQSYKLLGRFCDFKTYSLMIFETLRGKYCRDEEYMRSALISLDYLC